LLKRLPFTGNGDRHRKDTTLARRKKLGRKIGFVVAMAAALIGISSVPAFAGGQVYQGSDTAWTVGAVGVTLWVQDNECDNHRVYAEATWDNGLSYMSVIDYDGCGGDSYFENTFNGHGIQKIRVCEVSVACSAWKNVWT
jgi:hypothetical protein